MQMRCLWVFLLLLATYARAENVDWVEGLKAIDLSANVNLTNNYSWRGVSQSNNSAAIQGGFDAGIKGLYAGVWGSNVNFVNGDNGSMELDVYGGYEYDLGNQFVLDLGVIRYIYPRAFGLDFTEYYGFIKYDFAKVGIYYSDNAFNLAGYSLYYTGAIDYTIPKQYLHDIEGVGVNASIGYYEMETIVGRSYTDWLIGISKTFKNKMKIGLAWKDTNGKFIAGKWDNSYVLVSLSWSSA